MSRRRAQARSSPPLRVACALLIGAQVCLGASTADERGARSCLSPEILLRPPAVSLVQSASPMLSKATVDEVWPGGDSFSSGPKLSAVGTAIAAPACLVQSVPPSLSKAAVNGLWSDETPSSSGRQALPAGQPLAPARLAQAAVPKLLKATFDRLWPNRNLSSGIPPQSEDKATFDRLWHNRNLSSGIAPQSEDKASISPNKELLALVASSVSPGMTLMLVCITAALCCVFLFPIGAVALGDDSQKDRRKGGMRQPQQQNDGGGGGRPPLVAASSSSRGASAASHPLQEASKHSTEPARPQGKQLYSDLIVPPDWQCILRVPMGPLSGGPGDIVDPHDDVVIRVVPGRPSLWAQTGEGGHPILFSLKSESHVELAQCTMRSGANQEPEYHFNLLAGRYTAILFKVGGQYTVETLKGEKMLLVESPHKVSIQTVGGKEVAVTEPDAGGDGYFKLQVQPTADVGLVLCVLICVNHVAQRRQLAS